MLGWEESPAYLWHLSDVILRFPGLPPKVDPWGKTGVRMKEWFGARGDFQSGCVPVWTVTSLDVPEVRQ